MTVQILIFHYHMNQSEEDKCTQCQSIAWVAQSKTLKDGCLESVAFQFPPVSQKPQSFTLENKKTTEIPVKIVKMGNLVQTFKTSKYPLPTLKRENTLEYFFYLRYWTKYHWIKKMRPKKV